MTNSSEAIYGKKQQCRRFRNWRECGKICIRRKLDIDEGIQKHPVVAGERLLNNADFGKDQQSFQTLELPKI